MGGILNLLDRIYNSLVRLFAWLACALILIMTALITYSVAVRYFFNSPIAWITEVTEYSLMVITFMGAPWLLQKHGHVRLDVVLNALAPKQQNMLEIINSIIGVIISTAVTWFGFWTAVDLYQRGITVINILKIQKYLLILIIPISGFLLAIQFLKFTCHHLSKNKKGGNEEETTGVSA